MTRHLIGNRLTFIGEDHHKNEVSIKVVLFIPAKGDDPGEF